MIQCFVKHAYEPVFTGETSRGYCMSAGLTLRKAFIRA